MNKIIFLFSVLLITVTSCRKDVHIDDETIIIRVEDDVTTNLHGRVMDISGRSIAEAEVIVEDLSVFSNGDGYFYMPNISVPSDGFVITVRSFNNKNIIRRSTPQVGKNTYEEIVVTSAPQSSAFPVTNESVVTNGQATVTIPPNSLIDMDGNEYQGDYLATIIHYSPTERNILKAMPGNLQGIDKNGDRVTLGSFGMIDIEVTDVNGAPLNLAPDKKALVEMRIPGSLMENMPSSIPTWKLDETSGLWLEDGKTTDLILIEDIAFINFDIDEFRIWNCDVKEVNTNLSGTITDQFGVPIENRLIQFNFASDNQEFICSGGNTNSLGEFNTRVPKDVTLTISIYDNSCMNIIYTEEIGSFSEDANIKIDTELSIESYTITGVVIDCTGDIVFDNATVFLYDQEDNVRVNTQTNADGTFAIHNTCYDINFDEGYGIGVLDLDTGNYILKDSLIFSEIDIDLGNIIPCQEIDEFINIESGFEELSFDDPDAIYSIDSLIITAGPTPDGFSFSLVANVSEEGINPVSYIEIQYSNDITLTCNSQFDHTVCSEAVILTITDLDEQAKVITGMIQGLLYYGDIVEPGSSLSSDVSINFKVKY